MDSTPPAATPPAYPGRCRPRAACHRPVLLSRPRPAGHALAVIGRASGPGRVTIGRDSGSLVSGARHVYVGAGRKAKTPADSAWPRGSAAAMERDGQLLSARPALETEGLRYLHVTGESGRGPRARTASSPGRRHVRCVVLCCAPGRAWGGLGRPGEAWPAAGRRRTQVREEGLERARRPSRSRTSPGGAVGPFVA